MHIFDRDGKVNFIDQNNVVVGYDMQQSCCEHADWFISKDKRGYRYGDEHTSYGDHAETSDYSFDAHYFETVDCPDLDRGDMVRFRLVADGKPDLYLHLLNAHNGYYSHGFTVEVGGSVVRQGSL